MLKSEQYKDYECSMVCNSTQFEYLKCSVVVCPDPCFTYCMVLHL